MPASKRLYTKVALMLLEQQRIARGDLGESVQVIEITRRLASIFAEDNPRFDAEQFYRAAGVSLP
jgi:hypothetical protein